MEAARKQETPGDDLWVSMYQAASTLKCSRYLVGQFIGRGKLTSNFVAGRTVVLRDDVERLRAEREAAAASQAG